MPRHSGDASPSSPNRSGPVRMAYRLRYLHHNLELAPGQFLIGRSTECQLSLDDPLVSRKHALLTITSDSVFVEDMGSRNGVLVDGTKIEGRRRVGDGSRITIGSQDMVLLEGQRERAATMSALPAALVTFVGGEAPLLPSPPLAVTPPTPAPPAPPVPPEDEASKKNDTFKLLGGVAEKAMAMGRADDAERLLQTLMMQVIEAARAQRILDPLTVEQAGRFGAKLAVVTTKSSWFDYVVELYTLENRIMPASVVDEMHQAVRKVPAINLPALQEYLGNLQENTARLGPNERFLLQRLEGLLRLAALKLSGSFGLLLRRDNALSRGVADGLVRIIPEQQDPGRRGSRVERNGAAYQPILVHREKLKVLLGDLWRTCEFKDRRNVSTMVDLLQQRERWGRAIAEQIHRRNPADELLKDRRRGP